MKEKLTVIIPCKNERLNIRECIEAARPVADEILIADSGSTDGTLEIVEEVGGCRVIEREYIHSGDFKNWAIPQANHPWVLILDADERVGEKMAEEIQSLMKQGADQLQDGYWIYRENYFMGHRIRYSGWQNDRVLRLFRREAGRYVGNTDHAEVSIPTGRIGRLKHKLVHYSYWSYDQYFGKFQRYTDYQASVWQEKGRQPQLLKMLFNAPLRFLHAYIIRGGFLDGMAGLQVCMLTGFHSFMKQARLWERQHAEPQPDPEIERQEIDEKARTVKMVIPEPSRKAA